MNSRGQGELTACTTSRNTMELNSGNVNEFITYCIQKAQRDTTSMQEPSHDDDGKSKAARTQKKKLAK